MWVTRLGDPPIRLAVVTLVTGVLIAAQARRPALFLLGAVVTGALVVALMKAGFARSRPDLLSRLDDVRNASMPSGHAASGTLVWVGSALALGARWPARRGVLLGVAIPLAIAIGLSRLVLGVHWPSDVAAGWAFAAGWLCLWWLVVLRVPQEPRSS